MALLQHPNDSPEPGLDVRQAFRIIWSQRVRIGAVALAAALVMFAIAFALPKWYRATAVSLPPEESDLLSNMSLAQRALSKFPRFGVLDDYYTPADIFKAVLGSRTVQEEIVRIYDLQRVYHRPSMEKTIKELKNHYKVKLNPDGTLAVSVDDTDPKRAAAMANRFFDLLDRYNVEKRNTTAHRTRLFLERRVEQTDSLLQVSELALKRYQEAHHTVVPPTSGSADMRAAADLMSRKIMLEVRLGMLRNYLRDDNEQVVQTRLELDQLNERIGGLPRLQSDIVRLTRDSKIQEQLFLLLTAELEQARIRETMDTPTVQVLDAAVPPERHSKPRRLMLAAAAGILGFLGMAAWCVLREGAEAAAPR
jgi:tyrosine-protein kinase Etk/Wzc